MLKTEGIILLIIFLPCRAWALGLSQNTGDLRRTWQAGADGQ